MTLSHRLSIALLKIASEIFQTYTEYENRYFAWPTYEQYGFNDYHPNGYDAIWAAALALNASIEILAQEVMSILCHQHFHPCATLKFLK